MSYVVKGKMVAGFALFARLAIYGMTRIETFIVNQAYIYTHDFGYAAR